MIHRVPVRSLLRFAFVTVLAAACSTPAATTDVDALDPDASVDDAATLAPDATVPDDDAATPFDATVTPDAIVATPDTAVTPVPDASASDAARPADATVSATDASVTDALATDALQCTELDLEIALIRCNGAPVYMHHWTDTSHTPGCPDYYTIGESRYETLADVLALATCDPSCIYRPSTSVTLLRCGRRTGYINYTTGTSDDLDAAVDSGNGDGGGCGIIVETSDGLFTSVDEWNASHPCPDGG